LSATGPLSPSFRIRAAIPGRALVDHGISICEMPLFSNAQDRSFRAGGAWLKGRTILEARQAMRARLPAPVDVAWILRQADMLPSLRIEELASADRRLVLDVDDPIWLDSTPSAGGHRLAFLKGTRRKVRVLAQRADTIVAGNAYLADWLAQYASSVKIIPSVVDTEHSVQRAHEASETVVLGWIGSPSSFGHLERLAPSLADAARIARDIDFEVWTMGGGDIRVPGMRCRAVAWSEDAESDFLGRIDIGLMPLGDNPWTRGKCAYKALQYMAACIPVVADDVGVSAEVIGDGRAGHVVKSRSDWSEAIVSLARDVGERVRLGMGGRSRVVADYSLQRWLPDIAKALTGAPFLGETEIRLQDHLASDGE
jgi:glycosyltransferase involved in cell wall biosynthesis